MTAPATTPLTYNGYINQIATMAIVGSFTPASTTVINGITYTAGIAYGGTQGSPDTNFATIVPQMLNYAELRIQRDIDFLQSQVENTSYSFTAGNNVLSLSVNDFVTLQTVNVITSSSPKTTSPLLPVTKQFIQNVYPSSATTGVPAYFAPYGGDAATYGGTSQNIIVGPWPDAGYAVSLTGTIRLQSLYANSTTSAAASTATTFISTYFPDLLLQASMIYISQYQRNFGPASNDPSMGPSYEAQYQTLLKGAMVEEARKKFESTGWASESPAIIATPTRG